ncbi:MAG TPA: NUDIX hydrolase [Aestuariivirga sp.]|nr:NUDIX hydrolase [Aestuariivirga sp.]
MALKHLAKKKATIKPRDAATLILVRFDGPLPRILMGQRHEGHAFMPNKYVFPGGRCEAADGHLPVANEGDSVTLEKLKLRMGAKPSHRKARGVLVAALRETFEETGLLAGRATAGAAPDLTGLIYFARAITPPGRSRRFDSRFFVADARIVSNLDAPHSLENEELLQINWVTLAEALGLNLPSITRDILLLLQPYLAQNRLPPAGCPVSFQYNRGKSWRVEELNLTFGTG